MPRHSVFTIVTDISSDESEGALRALLACQSKRDAILEHLKTLEMLHFCCFVVFSHHGRLVERSKSLLVLECNIDGRIEPFLDRLMACDVVHEIYCHCDDYPTDGSREEQCAYLGRKKKRPNLYHIGAPYKSVGSIQQERDLRKQLDDRLDKEMQRKLGEHLSNEAAGVREYWTWEVFKPWFAWLVGIGGPTAALALSILSWPLPLMRTAVLLLTIAYTLMAIASIVAAFKLWYSTPPDLRDRARPWIQWVAVSVPLALIVRALWERDRRWAVGLAVAFAAVTLYGLYAAALRRTNERLQEIRAGSADPSLLSVWSALRSLAIHIDDGPAFLEWLWNAKWWFVAYVVMVILVVLADRGTMVFVAVLTAVFYLKSLWLLRLLGWPAPEAIKQDTARMWGFQVGVTVTAAAGFSILKVVHTPVLFLGLIVLVAFFSMWMVPLPSPKPTHKPLARKALRDLVSEEDQDVTNHMAAVVVLRDDRFYRVMVLRSFLLLLNNLFFRSWLPDLYCGKLFGIPTVHFAQWIVLDRRNYLFLSNYDNSWTSYLDDFGIRLESGIQKIWGQGENNPGTKDLARFKLFARGTMTTHALWYRAYPELTLRQIWNNDQIRRALVAATQEEAMAAALRRLGVAPKTLSDLLHARTN